MRGIPSSSLRRAALVGLLAAAVLVPNLAATPPSVIPPAGDAALDELLARLGLARDDLRFPKDLAPSDLRLPAVDRVLDDPLALPLLAAPWREMARDAGRIGDAGALAFPASSQGLDLLGVSARDRYDLGPEEEALDQLLSVKEERDQVLAVAPEMPEPWANALATLSIDLARARALLADALEPLDPATRRQVLAVLPGLWFEGTSEDTGPGGREAGSGLPGTPPAVGAEPGDPREALLAGGRLDRVALARSAGTLLLAVDTFLRLRPAAGIGGPFREDVPGVDGPAIGPIPLAAGNLYIGGPGPNRWRCGDAAVIVDLGGNDTWELPPPPPALDGGATLRVLLDLGGDDTWRANGWGSLGGGVLGLSLLRDLGGNDRYEGAVLSLGAAWFGVGALLDDGGDDVYSAAALSEGAAGFGLGILADAGGNDAYLLGREGQGFGTTLGAGILADLSGHDTYRVGTRWTHRPLLPERLQGLGQGMGLGHRYHQVAGGVGVLWDAAGNDRYEAGVYGQGAGYWYSLGMLIDGGGHDAYTLVQYGQGAGIHLAAGALVDVAGDDVRTATYGPAQGAAHDLAAGLLVDLAGDDVEFCGGIGQGQGHANGVAIHLDVAGDDVYAARAVRDVGGTATPARETGSFGFFLDLGGMDVYPGPPLRNDATWTRGTWGGGLDREAPPADGKEPGREDGR